MPCSATITRSTAKLNTIQSVEDRHQRDERSSDEIGDEHGRTRTEPIDDATARDAENGHRHQLDREDDTHERRGAGRDEDEPGSARADICEPSDEIVSPARSARIGRRRINPPLHYLAPPVVGTDQTEWKVDCGAANDRNARGTLGPALAQQGWTSCGAGLATAQWRKNDLMLGVAESSLATGDHPRLTQFARVMSPCL